MDSRLDLSSSPSPVDALAVPSNLYQVMKKFEDANEYEEFFIRLLDLEENYDKTLKESQSKQSLNVRWDIGYKESQSKKYTAYFVFPKEEKELPFAPGVELCLRLGDALHPTWQSVGHVIKLNEHEEVALELHDNQGVPVDVSNGFTIDFIGKSTRFDRMRAAIKSVSSIDSGFIFRHLLGDVEEVEIQMGSSDSSMQMGSSDFSHFEAPGLPELDASQVSAVKSALQKPVSLIQGPPGTGKTDTSAAIVYNMAKQGQGQVLVCAPSNVAVDLLTEIISATGLKVVRLCEQKADIDTTESTETEMIQKADVVCCTCVGAGDPRLATCSFTKVLIDEATQATEPECIIPLVLRGVKQVVLVGDPCQLGPVILCTIAAHCGLAQSLFERLVLLGVEPLKLQVQYRMHPALSEFPSNSFYEGTLQNGITINERKSTGIDWPVPNRPMLFHVQVGQESISASGTSYLNRQEAVNVEKIVTSFMKSGVDPSQIGVITPYEGQRAYIVNYMAKIGSLSQEMYKEIEVGSVDTYQGREKDYIILSCVRSSDQQGIGFLDDHRRLNVALTRARYGIVILGNPEVLTKLNHWGSLLTHYEGLKCLVEGPLNMIHFQNPEKIDNGTTSGRSRGGCCKTGTSVIGINKGDHGILSSESYLSEPSNAVIFRKNFRKTELVCKGVWIACAGTDGPIKRVLKSIRLAASNAFGLDGPPSMFEVVEFVTGYLNLHVVLEDLDHMIECILIGTINAAPVEMYVIEASYDPNIGDNVYVYEKCTTEFAYIGCGKDILMGYTEMANLKRLMPFEESMKHGCYSVQTAICFDWCSGGAIRVAGVQVGKKDTFSLWTQPDESNCNNPYDENGPHILEDP